MTSWKIVGVAALLLRSAVQVGGQCRLCESSSAKTPSSPATAAADVEIQVETNLNFDRMILAGPGSGAATIRPDGSSGVEGSILELGPQASVGTVLVHGEPNRTVRIQLPRRIELYSLTGGRIMLDDVTADCGTLGMLDAAGNLRFRFGGRIILSGDASGPFHGDLPVTVEYQ